MKIIKIMPIMAAIALMLSFTQVNLHAATPNQIMAYKADQLIGVPVWSKTGEDLGTVKNMIIDENGRVTLAIIKQEGSQDFGRERYVAVPFKALTFSRVRPQETAVYLDVSKEKLSSAPSYDPNQDVLPQEQVAAIYRFFGQQPYWTESTR